MNRIIRRRTLIRLVVSLALVGFLLWRIDLRAAGEALRDANYVFVVPALAIFGLSKLLVAQRWRLMMSKFAHLPLPPLYGVLLVSNLANNVLPARLGDVVRVQVPAQRYDISRTRLTATVFATESLLDGIAFAVLGLIGLALIDLQGFPTSVFWGMLGLVAGALIAVIPFAHLQPQEGWTRRGVVAKLPARLRDPLESLLPHFIDGLAVFRDLKLGFQALALSFAIWLHEVAMFALFGLAFNIELSLAAWMLIMVAENLVSAIPITPSNIGTYELALTELAIALGVAIGAASAFAIATHVFIVLWITVAGFIAMWLLGLDLNDVFSLARRAKHPGEELQDEAARVPS